MAGFEITAQPAACLGDDLDTPFDQPLPLPIRLEGFERQIAERAADAFDSLDDLRKNAEALNSKRCSDALLQRPP
jgi:hypothetical protein